MNEYTIEQYNEDMKLIKYVIRKYCKFMLNYKDLYDDARMKAISLAPRIRAKFDASKAKYATYAILQFRGAVSSYLKCGPGLKFMRALTGVIPASISLDEKLSNDADATFADIIGSSNDISDNMDYEQLKKYIQQAIDVQSRTKTGKLKKTTNISKAIKMRLLGYSYCVIADKLNISHQAAQEIFSKFQTILKNILLQQQFCTQNYFDQTHKPTI